MTTRFLALALCTAALAAAQSPAPELALSANGRSTATLHPGQPLMVQLSAVHPHMLDPEPGEDVPPVVLPAVEGSWAHSVHMTLFNDQGEALDLPLTLHTPPEERLELAHGEQASAWWSLSPEQTAALAPGNYILYTVVDTTQAATGDEWNGAITLDTVPVTLTAVPEEPSVDDQAAGYRLAAEYAALLSNWEEALRQVESWITLQPESALPYALKGDLLTQAGRPLLAAQFYNKATELDAAATQAAEIHPREQHSTLDQKISDILRSLAKGN